MNYTKQTKITVAGVSQNPTKYGHKIFRDLLAAGYDVVGVNPKGGTILEQEIFTSLADVPRETELLIIVVPPAVGISLIKEARQLEIQNVWLQPGAESDEIVQFAEENGMNATYNSCFMTEHGIW